MRVAMTVVAALWLVAGPPGLAAQADASGTIVPVGPAVGSPVRVDAGGACVVDLVQEYVIDGTLSGELSVDYRILVAGPCGFPAGTYDEEWIAHGTFSGSAHGKGVDATLLYTAHVAEGGSVAGTMVFRGGVDGELEVVGDFADQRLSYRGVLHDPRDGGR